MAANPKRKGISTLPVYLPRMSSARRGTSAPKAAAVSESPHLYIEGGFDPAAAEALAQLVTASGGLKAVVLGEMISALPRGPQIALRHAVATTARALASARVRNQNDKGQAVLPLRGEVDQEESSLRARTHHEYQDIPAKPLTANLVYSGDAVQAAFGELLPTSGSATNIVVTSRALASWDQRKKAWVPQTVVPGNPVLVGLSAGTKMPDAASLAAAVKAALAN